MNKPGFTLTEALLAVGIIGIIAAILAPSVNSMLPDKNKPMVLKYYSEIAKKTDEMLDNEYIYYSGTRQDANGLYSPTCDGLACVGQPLLPPYNDPADVALYSGNAKYPNILGDMLNLNRINDNNFENNEGTSRLTIERRPGAVGANPQPPFYLVTLNLDLDNAGACIYSADCESPDIFTFRVSDFGTVTPNDAMTAAYIQDPKRSKRGDRRSALILLKMKKEKNKIKN